MGSIAEELSAGVRQGIIRRRELGLHLARKGFQASAVSRSLGQAVEKWGTLSKIGIASGETCYVPCDGPYDALDEFFERPESSRFTFRLRRSFHGMSRYSRETQLLADVVAKESSTNCKAKVAVIPLGETEFQAYWQQPHDIPCIDLNQGETARVELAQLANPMAREISNYESTLRRETDSGVIEHVKLRLEDTHERAARQQPVPFVRTPDVEGGRAWGVDGQVVYVLILSVYSAEGWGWFPILFLRKHLEESEIVPIVRYKSRRVVEWSGKGIYSE
jgi:hypothetical protein